MLLKRISRTPRRPIEKNTWPSSSWTDHDRSQSQSIEERPADFQPGVLVFLAFVAWLVWHKSGSLRRRLELLLAGWRWTGGFCGPAVVRPLFIVLMVSTIPSVGS